MRNRFRAKLVGLLVPKQPNIRKVEWLLGGDKQPYHLRYKQI